MMLPPSVTFAYVFNAVIKSHLHDGIQNHKSTTQLLTLMTLYHRTAVACVACQISCRQALLRSHEAMRSAYQHGSSS